MDPLASAALKRQAKVFAVDIFKSLVFWLLIEILNFLNFRFSNFRNPMAILFTILRSYAIEHLILVNYCNVDRLPVLVEDLPNFLTYVAKQRTLVILLLYFSHELDCEIGFILTLNIFFSHLHIHLIFILHNAFWKLTNLIIYF